jgi:hypothetical protein
MVRESWASNSHGMALMSTLSPMFSMLRFLSLPISRGKLSEKLLDLSDNVSTTGRLSMVGGICPPRVYTIGATC